MAVRADPGLQRVPQHGQWVQLLPGQAWVSRRWRGRCEIHCSLPPPSPPPPCLVGSRGRCFPWPFCNGIKWGQQHLEFFCGGISPPRSRTEGWWGPWSAWLSPVVGHCPTAGTELPDPAFAGAPLTSALASPWGKLGVPRTCWPLGAHLPRIFRGRHPGMDGFWQIQWALCPALAVPWATSTGGVTGQHGGGPSPAGNSNPVVSIQLVS